MGAPIPADADIAALPTISFSSLTARDPNELDKWLQACQDVGFFYLDLRGAASKNILQDWRSVLDFIALYFDQDLSTKSLDDRRSDTYGYEPVSTSAGAKPGEVDCYETLKVARAELQDRDPKLPKAVMDRLPLFDHVVDTSQFIVMTLLTCLSNKLDLNDDISFEHAHRSDHPSRTILVLFRYFRNENDTAGVGHNKHTDIGTFTLLFSEQYGLQVLSPDNDKWQFIQPKSEHAVINVVDSLRFLSGKNFNSCVHRVIPTAETQQEHRYSIAYFLRAEDDAIYLDSHDHQMSAKEWHDGKI